MKILCTADWHIGKKIEAFSRFEEQKEILMEIVDISESEQVDAIIIAGDCFDTQNPSPEMIKLFVKTLARLSHGGKCLVLVIAGNHDNPLFLSSSEAFSSQVGVVILGFPNDVPLLENSHSPWTITKYDNALLEIYFKKNKKTIRFLMAPYANAQRLKKDLGITNIEKKAWEIITENWQNNLSDNESITNIVIAHYYFLPEKKEGFYQEEAPIEDIGERSIGGMIGGISLTNIPHGVDYLIAGHIHKPQQIYSPRIKAYYTGSPLIYSTSESGQEKSILILDLGRKNREYRIPLTIKRDIKTIFFDSFDNIFEILEYNKENYIILIWQEKYLFSALEGQQLRAAHPRILRIESQVKKINDELELINTKSIAEQSEEELFIEYFSCDPKYKNQLPGEELILVFNECLHEENTIKSLPKKTGFLPKKIKIKGFYSYKKEMEIDFSDLDDKKFFGIFGAVGSGKSALIEAIILSIFGKVQRLGAIRSSRSDSNFSVKYSMMNIESDELLIEFTFEINGESGIEEYLCRIHGSRDKKKFTEIKLQRHILIKKSSEWIECDTNEGEEILGILYDDFRKTIILQQRDFLGFISEKSSENAETLMRLFQLERFQLSEQVDNLLSTNTIIYNSLRDQLKGLEDISEEQLLEKQEQIDFLYMSKENQLIINNHLRAESQTIEIKLEKIKKLKEIVVERDDLLSKLEDFEKAKNRQRIILLLEFDKNIYKYKNENIIYQEQADQNKECLKYNRQQLELLENNKNQISNESDIIQLDISSLQKKYEELLLQQDKEKIINLEIKIKEYNQLYDKKLTLEYKKSSLQEITAIISELLNEINKTKDKENTLRDLEGLKTAIKYLKENQACPLCGSFEHPNPCIPFDDIELQKNTQILTELQKKYEQVIIADNSLTEVNHELQLIDLNLKSYHSINILEQECSILLKQEKAKELDILNLKKQINELRNKYQYYSNRLQEEQNNTDRLLREDIKLETQLNNMNDNLIKNIEKLESLQKERINEFNQLDIKEEEFNKIKNHPCKPNIEINYFFEKFNKIELIYNELSEYKNLQEEDFRIKYQKIENDLFNAQRIYDEIIKQSVILESEIKIINEQILSKKVTKQQFEEIQIRNDNLNLLKKLFKGKGFVRFIAQKYLNKLCYSANKRFLQFTRNQYELLAPSDLNEKSIMIVDRLAGGIKRDITTLSGGQSFQAALALALALSDESGTGHKFFFIDEGFGSLDEDSLSIVLETLRQLTINENRVVGLISHVPKIKEEVDVYLDVSLASEIGTTTTWIHNY